MAAAAAVAVAAVAVAAVAAAAVAVAVAVAARCDRGHSAGWAAATGAATGASAAERSPLPRLRRSLRVLRSRATQGTRKVNRQPPPRAY